MNKLIIEISKSKNFYGSDITIHDFTNNILFTEIKNSVTNVKIHMENFFKIDSEVLGYYVCKGQKLFKLYLVSVDKQLYITLDKIPPIYWHKIKTYDDFQNIKKAYNTKQSNSRFCNKIVRISNGLSNSMLGNNFCTINNNYEYLMILYNLCIASPFVMDNIYDNDEFHETKLDYSKYNSIDKTLLVKHIIDKNQGFNIRTVNSNSLSCTSRGYRGMISAFSTSSFFRLLKYL